MPQTLKIVYTVKPDLAALARHAAQFLVELAEKAVAERGVARIAVSGGSTPKTAFAALAEPGEEFSKRMPWNKLELYWVDERCVPPDHRDSNYRMTREALLDRVPLKPKQIHRIEGELKPEEAATRYEAEIRRSFGLKGTGLPQFDAVQLGMGIDGHTASLFPYSDALRVTDRAVAANFLYDKDAWRITLTAPVINQARTVFFLVAGVEKALILNQVFEGAHNPNQLPSQLIEPAGGILTLLLDQAAATLLPEPDADGCGVFERTK